MWTDPIQGSYDLNNGQFSLPKIPPFRYSLVSLVVSLNLLFTLIYIAC